MDAKAKWQLEMRRLLETFERESTSSLRKISRCFVALGRPFDEKFHQYFLKVSTLRLDTSFSTVLFEQSDGDASASNTNSAHLNVAIGRSLDASHDSDMLEIKIENNTDDDDTIETIDLDGEDCGNQHGMQASNGSNDDQIESNETAMLSCGAGQSNDEIINTDVNDLNGIEVDVKAEIKMEMESPSETEDLLFVVFDPNADNEASTEENGEIDAESLTDQNQTSTSSGAKEHSKKTSVKRFKCNKCAYTAQYKYLIERHQAIHKSVKSFKCEQCDYATRYKGHLIRHQQTHDRQKLMGVVQDPNSGLLKCTHCDQRFFKWGDLNLHLKRVHKDNQRLFNCKRCMRRFIQKTEKDRHEVQCQNRRYECHLCQYETPIMTNMQKHMRTHTGAKPFECIICNKCYRQKGDLRHHLDSIHMRA